MAYILDNVEEDAWLNREAEQIAADARALPYVVVEGDLDVGYQFEGWMANGNVVLHLFAVGSTKALSMAAEVENLFGPPANWRDISDPLITGVHFDEASLLKGVLEDEESPDKDGNPVYRYDCRLHVIANGKFGVPT